MKTLDLKALGTIAGGCCLCPPAPPACPPAPPAPGCGSAKSKKC